MTDQPETELEYHFSKLSRKMITATMVVTSALFLVGAVAAMGTDPTLALALALGAGALELLAVANTKEGLARRMVNLLPGDNIGEIERPSERSQEVPADD